MDKILKVIEEKAENRMVEISKEKERAVLIMEKEYSLAIKEKKEKQRGEALKEAAKEIEDFEKSLRLKINFKAQEQKNQILEQVYRLAEEKISNLPDEEFKKIVEYLNSCISQKTNGIFKAGPRTAKFLKEISENKKIDVKAELEKEGFVFISNDMEVDLTISGVLSQLKETANPELIKTLF